MTKITGRPPKGKKQEKNIGFFVTWSQYAVIRAKAEKAGVNISDYMRQMAVDGHVKAKWTKEERQMVKELIAAANGIHQLAEIAKKEGADWAMVEFLKCRNMMDKFIKKLCHAR